MRLDDGNLSWPDLHAFIFAAPPGTAIFNSIEKGWTTTDHLTATAVDLLMILAWQNTKDAQEKFPRHRPKPLPRPGDLDKLDAASAPLMGGATATVMSVEEFQRRIQERRANRGT